MDSHMYQRCNGAYFILAQRICQAQVLGIHPWYVAAKGVWGEASYFARTFQHRHKQENGSRCRLWDLVVVSSLSGIAGKCQGLRVLWIIRRRAKYDCNSISRAGRSQQPATKGIKCEWQEDRIGCIQCTYNLRALNICIISTNGTTIKCIPFTACWWWRLMESVCSGARSVCLSPRDKTCGSRWWWWWWVQREMHTRYI